MKTLNLVNKDQEVELEIRKNNCDYCGEKEKECVKSSGYVNVPKLEMGFILKDGFIDVFSYKIFDVCMGLFSKITVRHWVIDGGKDPSDLLDSAFIQIRGESEKIHTDICRDCIHQLAKLMK